MASSLKSHHLCPNSKVVVTHSLGIDTELPGQLKHIKYNETPDLSVTNVAILGWAIKALHHSSMCLMCVDIKVGQYKAVHIVCWLLVLCTYLMSTTKVLQA